MKLESRTPIRRAPRRRLIPEGLVNLTLGQRQRCPFCHDNLGQGEQLAACTGCRAVYHRECLGEEGHCRTLGCRFAAAPSPDAARGRRHWWTWRRIFLALAALLLVVVYKIFSYEPIEPPICILPPPPPRPFAQLLEPVPGAQHRFGQTVRIRGLLVGVDRPGPACRGIVPQVVVRSGQRVLARAYVEGEAFELDLPLTTGTHTLNIEAGTAGPQLWRWTRTVHVSPQPRPPTPAAVRPRIQMPKRTSASEVLVRGNLEGRGPATVTVLGPNGQQVSWQTTAPAPFAAAITLPMGEHTVEVVARDAQGRTTRARHTIRRLGSY